MIIARAEIRDRYPLRDGELHERRHVLEIGDLYEAPFTLRAPQGPEELFTGDVIDWIETTLREVRANAQPGA